LIGDSGFFHTTIPAICNAAHNEGNMLMIVLDNEGALASGRQTHPGINKNVRGEAASQLSIEKISRACGVNYIETVSLNDSREKLKSVFKELFLQNNLAMLILKIPV